MYKVKQSFQKITPFGGLNFIKNILTKNKIGQFIDNQLGIRNYRAKYSYSDIIFALLKNRVLL